MMHLTILSALLSALVLTSALPANLAPRQATNSAPDKGSSTSCSETKCQQGVAEWNSSIRVCVCPQWANQGPTNPCASVRCPDTTEIFFSSTTNQCICRVKNNTPVLIHQATQRIAQQNASVYSVKPYFLEGVISFLIELAGSPSGFNLNASTIIAADGIGTDPDPGVVLMPKNMQTRAPKSAEETALIIAATFNTDDTIAYHVQLNSGKIVMLHGDKYVHNIDLIDPNSPPNLSILTTHALAHFKRDAADSYEQDTPPLRSESVIMAERGIEGRTFDTAKFSQDYCSWLRCGRHGEGKPATYNPIIDDCWCPRLMGPYNHSSEKVERADSDVVEVLSHREAEDSLARPPFGKPSLETCRRVVKCNGESQPYFDEETSQCLCVLYRAGVKEPIITSDTTVIH